MAKVIKPKRSLLKRNYHRMTVPFGIGAYSNGSTHYGIDITGNPSVDDGYDYVVTPFSGTVVKTENKISGIIHTTSTPGMGNYVIIDNDEGHRSRFMHMKKGSVKVKAGDKVKAGTVIGYLDETGNTYGRHLHYDLSFATKKIDSLEHGGRYYVDPELYLNATKKTVTEDLNVRIGPSTGCKKVDELKKGTTIFVLETSGKWSRIGNNKWVSSNYLK